MIIRRSFVVIGKSVILDRSEVGLDVIKYIGTMEDSESEDAISLCMEKKEWDCLEVGSTTTIAISTIDRA